MTATATVAAGPGRAAYVALLACTTLGTLSSTIISAPINVIADALDASARGIVLAVSAFTLAMVLCAPVSGWMCERFGSRAVLASSLGLMVLAQAGAAFSRTLWFLVAMRAVQGVACSAVPPSVQQVLGRHWTADRGRVMAGWAAAIGVGQALGPPLGGLVSDALGWRWVFLTHAGLSLVLLALAVTLVPNVPAAPAPLHASGLTSVVVGVGALVGAIAWIGQDGTLVGAAVLVVVGAAALLVHAALSRGTRPLVPPTLLAEREYVGSTASAATVMACLGIILVATPLHLGRDLGLSPGPIGLVMLALALSMTLFAPVSSRLGERFGARATLRAGLLVLGLGLTALTLTPYAGAGSTTVAATVAVLVVTGCAIGAVQATSAHGLMTSTAAGHGAALGIHNMLRFAGLAVGYSWVAISYPTGSLVPVYTAPLVLVALSWVTTPSSAPVPTPEPVRRPVHDPC